MGGVSRLFTKNISANPTLGEVLLNGELGFRVEYYPFVNQRTVLFKQYPQTTKHLSLPMNQAAKTLDVERVLNNAQGTIDRPWVMVT